MNLRVITNNLVPNLGKEFYTKWILKPHPTAWEYINDRIKNMKKNAENVRKKMQINAFQFSRCRKGFVNPTSSKSSLTFTSDSFSFYF